MKYYQLLQSSRTADGERWWIEFPDRQFNGYWMCEGQPVQGWDERLIAVYPPGDFPAPDYPVTLNNWPIFSPRLRDFLEQEAPDAIQFLPFRLQQPDGSGEVLGYSVGQVLNRADCIDRAKTDVGSGGWTPINPFGDFDVRHPVVLRRDLIPDLSLFRIEGCSVKIVVRECLKQRIEGRSFVGPRFEEMELRG